MNANKIKELKSFLDERVAFFNQLPFIEPDPISIPHRFSKKADIEIAAFMAATIAWGQRPTILKNANWLMQQMDYAPHDFICNHSTTNLAPFKKFVHRTFNATDCMFFIQSLKNIYTKHKGLENCFSATDVKSGIIKFRTLFFETKHAERSEKHISNPADGSAAKRINMFLRWMVRKDKAGVDFGIWNCFTPAQLYCPLDVHSGNTARQLRILTRKQNDWKAVEELTANLQQLDKTDPVKYDFALFGIGASKLTTVSQTRQKSRT